MLHSPKMGQKFSWAKMASGANQMSIIAKISIFFAFFESLDFQLHHTPKSAKSDTNSKIWLKLKSERGLRFFIFFEDEKKSGRYAHGFGRHVQNVGKLIEFFFGQNKLPKVPKTHFLSFLGKNKSNRKWHDFLRLKTAKNLT